jgi:hypothetical protein
MIIVKRFNQLQMKKFGAWGLKVRLKVLAYGVKVIIFSKKKNPKEKKR